MGVPKDIKGKFQIRLMVKEFIDTGETFELQPIGDYEESCWGWDDAKESINFLIKRIEGKLNGENI